VVSIAATAFTGRIQLQSMKGKHGFGRPVMLMGSTGFRTFVDPAGNLHEVLRNCREAKIVLLDPLKQGVTARAKSIADPRITPELLREQVIRSIDFLKGLKSRGKDVRLKLRPGAPLVKLAILGDNLYLQHYPTGLYELKMQKYVFRHDQHGILFDHFYQYFVNEWSERDNPEYDLDTDDLVFRDKSGNEVGREKFNDVVMEY
jgi:hypothetical protein